MSNTPNTGSHVAEEKRRGSLAWLWIILAALILALLVWWFVAGDDEEDADAVTSPPAAVEEDVEPVDAPETAAVIRVGDTDLFDAGDDAASLVGESVEGNNVMVQAVVADEAFFVGPDSGETVLVFLPDFAGEQESPFDIQEGDKVSFTGTLKEVDQGLLSQMQLSDAPEIKVGDVYVEADQISPTT